MKKKMGIVDIILPNKKINYFIVTILILGLISGSIFLVTLSSVDKTSAIDQIKNFFEQVNSSNIDSGLALKNSLIVNYLFVFIIWFLASTIIGIIFNIFLIYIKGFILGFSLSSIILTYNYKAIPACILYIFPHQLINVFIICVLGIYSIMFAGNLLKIFMSKKGNNRLMIKKYFVILGFSIIGSFISSCLEVYLFPKLLKMIISLYL